MRDSLVSSIKSLPPLSKTIADINRVCADEEAGVGDLAKVIEKDPMIVANLLKEANAPLYGFGREIKSVMQAVSLFGMSKTRSLAIGNAIRKLLNIDMQPYRISSEEFAKISSLQAELMDIWYKKVNREKLEDLYLGALLQESGKIVIASEVLRENEELQFASEIEMNDNIAAVERAYVGASAAEVSALIFRHWGFENDFIEMIALSDTPQEAKEELREYAAALHIVKTIVPVNKALSEHAVHLGVAKAEQFGYDTTLLQEAVEELQNKQEEN